MNKELQRIRDEMAEKRVECICAFEREEYINTFKDGFDAGVIVAIEGREYICENCGKIDSKTCSFCINTYGTSKVKTIWTPYKDLQSKCQKLKDLLKEISEPIWDSNHPAIKYHEVQIDKETYKEIQDALKEFEDK